MIDTVPPVSPVSSLASPLNVTALVDSHPYEEQGRYGEFDLIGVALGEDPVPEFTGKRTHYTAKLLDDDLERHFGRPVAVKVIEAA